MRPIHAVRDLNAESGRPIAVAALRTEGARRAMLPREAHPARHPRPRTTARRMRVGALLSRPETQSCANGLPRWAR